MINVWEIYQMLDSYFALLLHLFYLIELLDSNTRSITDSGVSEVADDDDNVELEKSNVLLMGPTGSGMTFIKTHFFLIK